MRYTREHEPGNNGACPSISRGHQSCRPTTDRHQNAARRWSPAGRAVPETRRAPHDAESLGVRDVRASTHRTGVRHSLVGRACAAATAVVALLILALPVLADPAVPDALEIRSAIACRDLLETGDLFVAVHYNILYDPTAPPAETARDLYLIRLMDGVDQLGVVSPFPFYDDGYEQGIVGLYFPVAAGLVWEDPYVVTLQGSPVAWATPPTTSFVLGPTSYSGVAGQTANQQALYDWSIDAVQKLESNWAVTLLESTDAGSILDETGQLYMTGAVPGLSALCPQLFWVQSASMDVSERTWGTAQADLYAARFDGTWVGDGMDSFAAMLHVTPQLLGGLLFVLVPFLGIIILCEQSFRTSTPALILLPLLMAMGALMGFLSMAVFAIVVVCFVLFLGYVLFFRTS